MTTSGSMKDTGADRSPTPEQYTVEQLARKVGMSVRNIRAYQTRKLLDPPVREGRAAYYGSGHVRRLGSIQALQEQGFNLAAIEAMLGGTVNAAPDGLAAVLQRVGADHPQLVYALSRLGVVGQAEDGTVRPIQSRVLQSTLNLNRAGLSAARSLQLLIEVLDSLRPFADELGQSTDARFDALSRRPEVSSVSDWDRVDRDPAGLRHGLADLLTEAFRVTVGNRHPGVDRSRIARTVAAPPRTVRAGVRQGVPG